MVLSHIIVEIGRYDLTGIDATGSFIAQYTAFNFPDIASIFSQLFFDHIALPPLEQPAARLSCAL